MSNQTKRVAVVSGASRGIGRAIAQRLAADGLAVVVNYHASVAAAAEVVAQIEAAGGQAIAVQADVGASDDRRRLVDEALARFGRVDVLVNNAGVTSQGRKDLLEATEESWNTVFDTNLKGPFFLAQLVARAMIEQSKQEEGSSGVIVNVSSISALAATTNRADYCIAKSALEMMTWLLADRLAEFGVQVFDVCPGVIASDMTAPAQAKYDALIADGLTPIRRWGQPQDVAQTVSTLVAGQLPFCTGQRIFVDGGFHVRRL
ncbi:MAG: 3-ketoacyl-ACP reductase [Planctomycetales bacterium]|nr:3-ketoacyl-ACP reductase [Planctomycetales bacterium]